MSLSFRFKGYISSLLKINEVNGSCKPLTILVERKIDLQYYSLFLLL